MSVLSRIGSKGRNRVVAVSAPMTCRAGAGGIGVLHAGKTRDEAGVVKSRVWLSGQVIRAEGKA